MKFEIKHLVSGALLFECEAGSLRLAVQLAVERKTDLEGANLKGAYLKGANLKGANLEGANLKPSTVLDTGETFEQYLKETLPALCAAGGRAVADVITREHWDCHEWANCPMAAAFGVQEEAKVPLLLRPRARQFVKLFDSGLIPLAAAREAARLPPLVEAAPR
ncbi:MAG TPA: pentapeptide repeat-containing protein [Planctomycetota bacterium]|nr:pentapeptide repeat-containing protein [Planctomycetota bacterium]